MPKRERALVIGGLALYWPLLTLSKTALDAAFSDTAQLGALSLVLSIAMIACALAMPRANRLLGTLSSDPRPAVLCGTATSVILALGMALPNGTVIEALLGGLGCLAAAVTICLLTLAWGEAAVRGFDDAGAPRNFASQLLIDVAASLFLSFAMRLVTALLTGAGAAVPPGSVVLIAHPLLACLPLLAYAREAQTTLAQGSAERHPDEKERERGASQDAERASLSQQIASQAQRENRAPLVEGSERWLLIVAALFVVLVSALAGIRTSGTSVYPIDPSGTRYYLALAFSGVLAACSWALRAQPAVGRAVSWVATIVLAFAGVLLTMSANAGASVLGINALLVARLVVWTLFWMLPVEAAVRRAVTGQAIAEIPCATSALLARYYLVPQAIAYLATDSLFMFGPAATEPAARGAFDIVTLLIALALMACALVIAALLASQGTRTAPPATGSTDATQTSASAGEASPSPSAPPAPDPRHAVCQALAEEFGLTEREAAVLESLSQGHTVQRIAEEQGVTPNTIRTHTKGLYRKLDCHAKQEVIDLVAGRMAQ